MQESMTQIMMDLTFQASVDNDMKRENANIDADSSMGTMLKYGSENAKKFYLDNLISPDIAEAHRNGDIHIHDLDFYALTETCCQIDMNKLFENGFYSGHGFVRTPNSIASYAALACIIIQSNQNDMHGGQSIPNWEYDLAPGVSKTFKSELSKAVEDYCVAVDMEQPDLGFIDDLIANHKSVLSDDVKNHIALPKVWDIAYNRTVRATYQAMEAVVHNLNMMQSRAGSQVPFSSINLGTGTTAEQRIIIEQFLKALDAGLGNGETSIFPVVIFRVKDGINGKPEDPNYDLFKLACKVSADRMFPNFEFLDATYNKAFIKGDDPNTYVATMGCVDKDELVSYKIDGVLYVESISRMYSRIGEMCQILKSGDSVYYDTSSLDVTIYDSHASGFVKVKKVIRNPDKGDWHFITFASGRVLRATADHPLPVEAKGRIPVSDIEVNDLVPITWYQPVQEEECQLTNDEMWLAGLVLCDASIDGITVVYLGIDERDIAEKAVEVSQPYYNSRIKEQHRGVKGDYLEVIIGGVESSRWFIKEFGGQCKLNRHIPSFVFRASREKRLSFMAGMIDADGYINCQNKGNIGIGGRVQIGSVNKELALQQMALAQSLGFPAKIYINDYGNEDKVSCRVEFGCSRDLLDAMHCEKKKQKQFNYPMHTLMSVFSRVKENKIDSEYKDFSYDVETESDHFDVSGICSYNCRTRVMANIHGDETTCGRGNLSFTTINLPRLGIKANGDISLFYSLLDNMLELAARQLLERFEIQSKRHVYNYPFLMKQGVWRDADKLDETDTVGEVLKHGTLTIGFIGLAECLTALIGQHHGESQRAWDLGYAIIKHMREACDKFTKQYQMNFSLLGTPAEALSGRFVAKDKELFGIRNGITDREYYTNSSHIPVWFNCSMKDKIKKEAPFHELCNGGHICYVELDGDASKNPEALENIVQFMKHCNVGYGSINHAVDFDPVCGYRGVIGDTCPRCGRHEGEGIPIEKLKELRKCNGY